MAISKFVPADLSKTAYFTLRRHATERHHAAPSSQSRWTTAERTMTPAEASLKGVDRPPAIKERATAYDIASTAWRAQTLGKRARGDEIFYIFWTGYQRNALPNDFRLQTANATAPLSVLP
jgi:hypothetical protein